MVYDVNVIFDKRKIFFFDEGIILKFLRGVLGTIYLVDYVIYSVKNLGVLDKEDDSFFSFVGL